jgi:chromosome segregation ATPase
MSDHPYKHVTGVAVRRLAESFFGTKAQRVYVEQDGLDHLVLREIEEGLRIERQSHEDASYFTLQELEAERAERKALRALSAESLHRERALRQAAETSLWACAKQLAETCSASRETQDQLTRERDTLSKQLAEARDQISQDPPRCHIRQSLAEARLQADRDDLAAKLKLQEALYGAEREANLRAGRELDVARQALTEVLQEREELRRALERAETKIDRVRGASGNPQGLTWRHG